MHLQWKTSIAAFDDDDDDAKHSMPFNCTSFAVYAQQHTTEHSADEHTEKTKLA